MRYKRGVAPWHVDRGQACEGEAASKGGRLLERGETVSLTNIEVSETSARPRAPFVAVQGKKVPSLNLSKCLYFSFASIFPRDSRPISLLYAPNAAIFLTYPQNDILARFSIFPRAHRHFRSHYSRLLVLLGFVHYLCVRSSDLLSPAFLPFLTRAYL